MDSSALGVKVEEHGLRPKPLRPTGKNSLRLAEAAATADASVAEEINLGILDDPQDQRRSLNGLSN